MRCAVIPPELSSGTGEAPHAIMYEYLCVHTCACVGIYTPLEDFLAFITQQHLYIVANCRLQALFPDQFVAGKTPAFLLPSVPAS